MRRFVSLSLFFALAAGLVQPVRVHAAAPDAKIPIDYKAYDSWNLVRGTKLSDDGNWIAYALVPEDGDPVLVVRDFATGKETREERGISPVFTADSKFVVYTIRAKNDDIHKAEREHKLPAEQPKSGLGILELATGKTTTFERVKSVKVPADPGTTTIAFAFEAPSPSPKPSGAPSPRATPPLIVPAEAPEVMRPPVAAPASAAPNVRVPLAAPVGTAPPELGPSPGPSLPATGATPSPSASPDDLHKIEDGTELVVRDLPSGKEYRTKSVGEYAIAHDGAYVAFANQAKDKKLDALRIRTSSNGHITSMMGEGHYRNLTFAPKQPAFALESDASSFADKAPHYDVIRYDLQNEATEMPDPSVTNRGVGAVSMTTKGLPRGWAPSANGALSFSRDGHRLFLGTAPAPTPVPSGTPEPMKVDIWSWNDRDLQPMQKLSADRERKRTYKAVVTDDGRFVQLATTAVKDVETNENPDVALGFNDDAYRKASSWTGRDANDVYAISLRDGSRRLLQRATERGSNFSPDGRFLVNYDPRKRSWYSLRTSDGRRSDLTSKLPIAFYDELDDHPRPPESYQFRGFTSDGTYAMLGDRYDVWVAELASGKIWMLTQGLGRKQHVRFFPLQLDTESKGFAADKPIFLQAFNDDNKDSGYYLARFNGPPESRMRKIVMAPKWITSFLKARNSDRVVMSEQRFDRPLDLWAAPSLDAAPVKISDANPQRSKYLWGSAKLVSYTSTWGAPLKGILLTPERFDPHKKYPMLVYFYERYADFLHHPPLATLPAPSTGPNLLRYVSNGYVVFIPDIAYRNGHPGQSALNCVMPGIAAVTKQGFVDEKRIGVAGHSWGAYQILYMLTQTNKFAAAEAGAAVVNMTSAYGGIRWGSGLVREFQYEVDQSRIGATPWDRLDLYVENSPLFHIKSIKTPYLTIANDNDDAVPWYQGIETITAMRRLGKPAWLFQFDGELHNLRGREQQKYYTVHMDEFFDHYLKGAPEPDWMKHGVDYLHRGFRDLRPTYGEAVKPSI